MSDALYPVFDQNGKYVYFTGSTDIGLSAGWLDMTSINRPVTRSVYVMVLKKDLPSPLAPESDEEKGAEAKKDESKPADKEKAASKPVPMQIDFENIGQRILALPIPARNYVGLAGGKEGILFLAEAPQVAGPEEEEGPTATIQRFDLSKRKTEKVLEGVKAFIVGVASSLPIAPSFAVGLYKESTIEVSDGFRTILRLSISRLRLEPGLRFSLRRTARGITS